jgi:methionyl-tRNA synthetase
MLIRKLDSSSFSRAYDILCQGIYPWNGVVETPFSSMWCVVEPGKVARAHKHQEHESFVIVKGHGLMRVDEESVEVEAGDVVLMNPFSVHELTNLSEDEDLLFLDLCWEDMAQAIAVNDAALQSTETAQSVLVTATPPTPNGEFHVGHLSGPYLSADIFTRYMKMRGIEARYLSGADDHQSYVQTKGQKTGATPQEVARLFGDAMPATLKRARIEMDHFARPNDSAHHAVLVQKVFKQLYEQGALVLREAPTLFCEGCAIYLSEAHVDGRCPHCNEGSGGNACEACGRPNDCVDLKDPLCHHCGSKPVIRQVPRFYFPLAPYQERLEEFFSAVEMNVHMKALCVQMLTDGLPDIAVSHPSDWGVPIPVDGFEDQRIYVWFEMAPGYLAATQELLEAEGNTEGWKGTWSEDHKRVVQFFGFDNGYFHAVLFPAIFLAYDEEIRLPSAFVVNEFYRYEGSKFSTSRNHAMWARELLDHVSADIARFCLAYDCPETEQTNFTLSGLEETARRQLVAGWEPWLRRLGEKLNTEFEGKLPGTGAWTEDQQRFFQSLNRLTKDAAEAYEAATFSPQKATRTLCELVRVARRFSKAEDHWRGLSSRYEERRTGVALEVLAAKSLALLSAPIMPDFAAGLWRDLGYETSLLWKSWEENPEFVPSGRILQGLDRRYFQLG